MLVDWVKQLLNTMGKRHRETFYLGGDYLLITRCDYFKNKYSGVPQFCLEDTVDVVLGDDWSELQIPIVEQFRNRMFWENKKIEQINEPILYGKMMDEGSPFRLAEIVLGSEIAFGKTIAEVDKLLKCNKLKIKKL